MSDSTPRKFRRVLLKLSGEALRQPGSTDNISPPIVEDMAAQIKAAHQTGLEIALVVGGGNSAVEEALYLSNLARKVTVVHRRDSFRSERILQERLFAKPNVEVIWNHVLEEVVGGENPPGVTGVRLKHATTGEIRDVSVDGVFVAIGHAPASELFKGQIEIRPNGYIKTAPNSTATNIPGVFAAGDVADDVYRQAVTAAGLGCMAALEAERFLTIHESQKQAAE
jgi:thioredoxin reductase (NADPH)